MTFLNWKEGGAALRQALAAEGIMVVLGGAGVFVESGDPVRAQQIVDTFVPDYAAEKADAKADIDHLAGQTRARFMTVTEGQESVYAEKAREADAWVADGRPSTGGGAYPHLEAEATASGITLGEVAENVLATRALWQGMLSPAIEATRMAGKRRIDATNDPTEIGAVLSETVASFAAIGAA